VRRARLIARGRARLRLQEFVVSLSPFVVSLSPFVVSLSPFVVSLSNHDLGAPSRSP
jgi:hypothetical protein